MPDFKYVGDPGRVYPSLPAGANGPKPGDTYSLQADPGDGRWEPVSRKLPSEAIKPTTDPAPAGETKE